MAGLFRRAVPRWLVIMFACAMAVQVQPRAEARLRGTTGIVEGRILSKDTGEPLVGVNVVILGTMYGAATDVDGYYQVTNVRAGIYDLRFSMVGYNTLTMRRVTILPDLRTRLDVQLEPTSIQLEAVEVRAHRPLIQKDLAATAFSIGDVKLEQLPVSTLQDVLGLQPGTTMEGNVRGGKTYEVGYLVDGLPVQDVLGGGLAAHLPKSSIAGMTIYTGGFDAEYGNAMSGVVNVLTKTGFANHWLNVRYERDGWIPEKWNQQQDRATEFEISAGGPLIRDKLFYFTAHDGLVSDTRWWQDFRRFFDSPIDREVSGFGKLDYTPSGSIRISAQALYSLKDWRDYEFSWRFNLGGLPPRSDRTARGAVILTHTLSNYAFYTLSLSTFYKRSMIGEGSRSSLSLQPYEYDFFLRYIVGGDRNWWARSQQISYTAKLDFTAQLQHMHLIKIGAEYIQYDLLSRVVKYEPQTTYFGKPLVDEPLLNYSNSYRYYPRSGSAYIQDKIELVRDGSNLSVGLRWDFLDPRARRPIIDYIPVSQVQTQYQEEIKGWTKARLKSQISPRLSFAAPVGPTSFFFVNWGHYFQFPLFEYLYAGLNPAQLRSGTQTVLAGNPDLDPERTIAWEIGFKYGLTADMVASATYFRKTFKNQIDSKTLIPADSKFAGDYGYASYVNNAEARSEGVELVLSRERGEYFSGSLSYTYMITEGVSEYADQRVNYAQWGFPLAVRPFPLSWDQRHAIKLDGTVQVPGGLESELVVVYSSPKPYTYYPTRDGFTPLDPNILLVPNNARMKDFFLINMKLRMQLAGGPDSPVRVIAFADIRNLLNAKNVRWVDSNGRVGGELNDPSAYYDPRRVRVGVQVDL